MKIFLSYRHGDSAGYAKLIRDEFTRALGADAVFRDHENIDYGDDFTRSLPDAMAAADTVLVVIGPDWAGPRSKPSRFLSEDDWVRREIVWSLQKTCPVIPLMVGGASRPSEKDLPDEMQPLFLNKALVLRDDRWNDDLGALFDQLGIVRPSPKFELSSLVPYAMLAPLFLPSSPREVTIGSGIAMSCAALFSLWRIRRTGRRGSLVAAIALLLGLVVLVAGFRSAV